MYRVFMSCVAVGVLYFGITVFFPHIQITRLQATSVPQVNSAVIATSTGGDPATLIDLIENASVNMYVSGEFEDGDGCGDVKNNGGNIDVFFYRSGVAGGAGCETNHANCYHVNFTGGDCSIFGCDLGTETTSTYECIIPVEYYSDPTDESSSYNAQNWVALVQATDSEFATGTFSATTEISSLLALDVSPTLAYGILSLGASSTSDSVLEVTNTGNMSLDVMISGTDMICDTGSLPVSQQHYALTSGNGYDTLTIIDATSTLVNINLSKQTSDELSVKSLYFKVLLPTSTLGGGCMGENIILATPDS